MANDFSGDPNCVALWRFENGALTTDSKGGNTLTDVNTPTADTTLYWEGASSVYFNKNDRDGYVLAEAGMDSGFPLKSTDGGSVISIAFWFRMTGVQTEAHLFSKYYSAANERSFNVLIDVNEKVLVRNGYNSGASMESVTHESILSIETPYHITVCHDGTANKTIAIRIRDVDGNTVGTDVSTTWANETSIESCSLYIGQNQASSGLATTYYAYGKMDELVVFKDILTATESNAIRAGTYSVTAADPESSLIGGKLIRGGLLTGRRMV